MFARAYIIYRQRRAELRAAKALLGVRDELKLGLAAVTVLSERYLLRDERGRPAESTGELMDRTANYVAMAEDQYRAGSSSQWADRFLCAATWPGVSAEFTAGGGTGYTFAHLRPAGDRVAGTGGTASGPLSFLRLYDTAAGVV